MKTTLESSIWGCAFCSGGKSAFRRTDAHFGESVMEKILLWFCSHGLWKVSDGILPWFYESQTKSKCDQGKLPGAICVSRQTHRLRANPLPVSSGPLVHLFQSNSQTWPCCAWDSYLSSHFSSDHDGNMTRAYSLDIPHVLVIIQSHYCVCFY